jgi:hypothetical protein
MAWPTQWPEIGRVETAGGILADWDDVIDDLGGALDAMVRAEAAHWLSASTARRNSFQSAS